MQSIPGFNLSNPLLVERANVLLKGEQHGGRSVLLRVPLEEESRPEDYARLRYGYELSATLNMPGVARVLELARSGNRLALVMEDFGAQSLRGLLREGGLPLVQATDIALKLARVLGELHREGIIHKDIQPSNVLLNLETGEVKVANFDLASRLDVEMPGLSGYARVEGRLAYVSPEQTGRMNRSVDYRTDLYSLGVTLYEMLTGRVPFLGLDAMALVYSHLALEPTAPHQLRPEIPQPLSAVVLKLLAKNAEERYQSAYGLITDLMVCLDELKATGTIAAFRPGRHDVSATFRIPQRLYGREQDASAVTAAFERVVEEQRSALLLVSGYSGVGKSSLVNELYRPLTRQSGYYSSGKFDQLLNVPYAAWIQAFEGLFRQILSEDEGRVSHWRTQLLEALGTNGRVVTDVVPQLELLIGPQPPVPELGATESQNRFNRAFQKLVEVLARREHPLILFLDDLQWADVASLNLLQRMLADPGLQNLLVIGAYRDNEMRPGHSLLAALNDLRKTPAHVTEVLLLPLGEECVRQLVADTVLRAVEEPEVGELTALVYQKTQGNPFFVNQFITSLHARGWLWFDAEQGLWRWSLEQIREQGITDNVAELMAERIAKLPAATQDSLKRAACVGNRFSLETLSVIGEQSPRQAAAALWEAVQQGLLLPIGEGYKYVQSAEAEPSLEDAKAVCYEFLHDRVQEAAYSLFGEEPSRQLHLRIGQLLLESTPEAQREGAIFDIINQLNQAIGLLCTADQREELARLNLQAGLRAKASSAFAQALEYLRVGLSLLREDCWSGQYALSFQLYRHRSECLHRMGQYDVAELDYKLLLQRAKTPLEKSDIYLLIVEMFMGRGQYVQAIQPGREGMMVLGLELPEVAEEIAAATTREMVRLQANLAGRTVLSLADLPESTDPIQRTRMLMMQQTLNYAAGVHPGLFMLISVMMLNRGIEDGYVPGVANGYAVYALSSVAMGVPKGDYASAFEYSQLASKLARRFDSPHEKPIVDFTTSAWVNPWFLPIDLCLREQEQCFRDCVDSGLLLWAGLSSMQVGVLGLLSSDSLGSQLKRLQPLLDFHRRNGEHHHEAVCQLGAAINCILRLMHGSLPPNSPSYFDEAYLLDHIQNHIVRAAYAIFWFRTGVLLGAPNQKELLERAEVMNDIVGGFGGWIVHAELIFYRGLVLAASHAVAESSEARMGFEQGIDSQLALLARFSTHCPENFLQKHRMLAAERARLAGRDLEAMDLYDEAIEAAVKVGYSHEVGLANELAARFHLSLGRRKVAQVYLKEARTAYSQWGARAKVAQLEELYPGLLPSTGLARKGLENRVDVLDLGTVLKASQAISGEIVLGELLRKLMSIMLENAGAQRGVLWLKGDGPLVVEARAKEGGESEVWTRGEGPQDMSDLPAAVLRYVERTGERVVLGDATREDAFRSDAYIAQHRPVSVLCMPVVKQKQLVGLLYLENNLTVGAFTPERCKVLELLSAQAAISLENARLYDTLEQRVRERTQALRESNEGLSLAMQHLKQTQSQLVMKEKLASLGSLTAGIAHEVKNPLNFVNNFALLSVQLTEELCDLVEAGRERLDRNQAEQILEIAADLRNNVVRINEHGRRADAIVRSMVDLSNSASGQFREANLNDLVRQFVELAYRGVQGQSREFHMELDLRLADGLAPMEVMPEELGRVIINLVNNACYALDVRRKSGEVGFTPRLQVTTRESERGVELLVRDNGTGIPAAIREKIFNPFFTTKPPGQGTGLGLSLSHDIIVQGHGGTLQVESVEGEYAQFVVTLPRPVETRGPARS